MKHFKAADGTLGLIPRSTVVAHGDLISFLNENDSKIYHTPRDLVKTELLREFRSHDYESAIAQTTARLGIPGFQIRSAASALVDELTCVKLLAEGKNTKESYHFVERSYIQPLQIFAIVTNRCNINCRYCYVEANQHLNDPEMPGEKWALLIDAMHIEGPYRSQVLTITGGEPTIHPGLPEILLAASGKYNLELATNGLYMSEGIVDALRTCSDHCMLNISIDSLNVEEDEVYRGRGTYSRRLENIKRLSEAGISITISAVIHSRTLDSLERTTEYFLESSLNLYMKFAPLTLIGRARTMTNSIFMTGDDIKVYNEKLAALKERYGPRIRTDPSGEGIAQRPIRGWIGRCSHMKYSAINPIESFEVPPDLPSERCNSGYGVIVIGPSGHLQPCLRAPSFFSELNEYLDGDTISPRVTDLAMEAIGHLAFWKYVSTEVQGFNPLKTCALKWLIQATASLD